MQLLVSQPWCSTIHHAEARLLQRYVQTNILLHGCSPLPMPSPILSDLTPPESSRPQLPHVALTVQAARRATCYLWPAPGGFLMLSAPVVAPWSKSLRVKNQLRDAVVSIFADGQRVGGAFATSPDMFVPLDPGFVLQPGQKVTASQEKDGDKSVPTAESSAVKVLKEPSLSLLGKILSRAPLSECGTCLWLEGVVPGADVTVMIGAASPVTVTAEWTGVHVDVPQLSPAEAVVVRQGRGAVVGPNVKLPPNSRKTARIVTSSTKSSGAALSL